MLLVSDVISVFKVSPNFPGSECILSALEVHHKIKMALVQTQGPFLWAWWPKVTSSLSFRVTEKLA